MTERYIVKHNGFNREKRRHDPNAQMLIDEAVKLGLPIFKNKPYEKK